jgi:hypothetical protein
LGQVEGVCEERWFSDTDAGTLPCQFGNLVPEIVAFDDAGVTAIAANVQVDGRFSFPGIPRGVYWLRFGTSWMQTAERSLTLSFESIGRPDRARAGAGTTLSIKMSPLDPWDEQFDSVNLYSSNVGAALEQFELTSPRIPRRGEISFEFSIPYDLYSNQLSTPMLDASKGDSAWVTQLRFDLSTNEYRIRTAGLLTPVTMVSGQTSFAAATLMPVPRTTTPLQIDQASFSTYASDFSADPNQPPGPSFPSIQFVAGPKPRHESLSDGLALLWGFYPTTPVAPPNPLSYPNPFPPAWGATVTVSQGNVLERTVANALEPRAYFSGVSTTLAIQELGTPVAATLSPPKSPQIDAMPFTALANPVSSSPTVTFSPPELGTPTRYVLRVDQLDLLATRTVSRPVANFYLLPTTTRFRLPAGVLVSGQTYVFVLTAVRSGGNTTRDLFDFRFPISTASVVSALVRP